MRRAFSLVEASFNLSKRQLSDRNAYFAPNPQIAVIFGRLTKKKIKMERLNELNKFV
jgi:hypothetical protein